MTGFPRPWMGLLIALAAFACSSADDGKDLNGQDAGVALDTLDKDLIGDGLTEDLAAEDALEAGDLLQAEVDDTPGCVGDFCAAGPDYAPDPSTWGPYPVGTRTFELATKDHQGRQRTIKVEVWYPTTEAFRDGPFIEYNMYLDSPPEVQVRMEPVKDNPPSIDVNVTRDTPVRKLDGPYPLIVFSHGAYGVRYQSIFYTLPLASHGYVVAAVDHTGNVLYDLFSGESYNSNDVVISAMDRPLDGVAVLDEMLRRNSAEGDFLEGTMIPEKIGFTGHSFGGYTSFYMGASDPRVKAIVAHTPATYPMGLAGYPLETFPIPGMIMSGTMDRTLDTEVEMRAAYEKMPAPRYYFELYTAGHFTYSDICSLDLLTLADALNFNDAENALTDGCGEENIPVEQAHPLINQFAIGFFNYYLRGSEGSLKYFDEAAGAKHTDELLYLMEK